MPSPPLALTLPDALRAASARDRHHPALTDGQRTLSYRGLADLDADPDATAGEVRALDAGDPFEVVVGLVRLTAAVAVAAPVDPDLPPAAHEALLARLHPVTPVRPGGRDGPDPDDVALVVATSGTTAQPTLVELTHRNLWASAEGARDRLGVTPDDGVLSLTPFSHVLALRATLDGLWIGCTVVVPRPAPTEGRLEALVEALEHPATTYASGSPAALEAVAAVYERRPAPRRLRLVRSGGAPLSPQSQHRIESALGLPVLVGYGMTQAAKIATPTFPPDPADAGTVGRPLVELRILDPDGAEVQPGDTGRIVIRGDGVCRRSHDGGELLDADGWLDTGDLGLLRDDRLVLVGRADHVINRSGEQVSPLAVEEALVSHADVTEALVTGIDTGRGTTVGALVVPTGHHATPTVTSIQEWLAPRLSPGQRPSVIQVVDTLPRDAKGAPDRRAAARLLADRPSGGPPGPEATDTTAEVSALWHALLGLDRGGFGPEDDFFAVGGDSLLALELAARLSELSGTEVAPGLALRLRTVAEQAAWLDRQHTEGPSPGAAVVDHAGPAEGPVVMILPGSGGTATGTHLVAEAIHLRLPGARVVTVETPVRHADPLVSVGDIAEAAVASMTAEGLCPAVLVGVSFGSLTLVEVVRQLEADVRTGIVQAVLVDLPRARPAGPGIGRVRSAVRILWSGRGVLPLRRVPTVLRPVRPLGDGTLPAEPAVWRTVARQRAELARTSPSAPLRDGPPFVLVATLRQVRRLKDVTLGWRGAVAPLRVHLVASNHERLLSVDAHLVADALDAEALQPR